MIRPELEHLIVTEAERQGVDPKLALAIALHESSGDPKATKYEPGYTYLVHPREWAEKVGIAYEAELRDQMTSWGLMQVMGGLAREYGFQEKLSTLADFPEFGVIYGVRCIKSKMHRYPTEADWISAYNQGNNRKTPGGMFQNQVYVDAVSAILRDLRKLL